MIAGFLIGAVFVFGLIAAFVWGVVIGYRIRKQEVIKDPSKWDLTK
jgi:hypothetical protein